MGQARIEYPAELLRCVSCGQSLITVRGLLEYDALCPDCGRVPWCRKRVVERRLELTLLPRRTPKESDIQQLADSLVGSDGIDLVVVDLSRLRSINSTLLARLISLNRRVRPLKGTVTLCGMSPVVREVLRRTHIDTLLEVLEEDSTAVDMEDTLTDDDTTYR